MKKNLKLISFILLAVPFCASAQLDFEQVIKPDSGKPINIVSDNMIIRNDEDLAIFTKSVVVNQGGMELKTDQLKVYSETDEKTKKNRFKLMVAEGSVYFTSQDKTVQSNKATYDVIKGILVLEGNVHMKDSESSLAGKIFRYDVKTGRSEIRNTGAGTGVAAAPASSSGAGSSAVSEEGGGRVRAVFVPGEGIKTMTTPLDSLNAVKNPDGKKPAEKKGN